ncbi:MAG: 4Fe-4S ferredoxin, partial [Bacteroidetes bacterium]
MGHLVGKDIYQKLGKKIDGSTIRTPMNKQLYAILKELYSHEEAELIVKMPYSLSSFNRIQRETGIEKTKLEGLLKSLCVKGLVMDIKPKNKFLYIISPLAVGIFEYTMMRTGEGLNTKKWAHLFHEYMQMPGGFYDANFGNKEKISIMRTLPHEETILPSEFVEILDYEKATEMVEKSNKFSVGICSCRHEKMHVGEKDCDTPLETCTSFDSSAEFLIRNNFAREISKSEMLDNLAISKEHNLVLNADNVKNNASFICQCCSCCCNLLLGVSKHGYPNTIVTSTYIAEVDEEKCNGCGKCAKACPVNVIEMHAEDSFEIKRKKTPLVDKDICLGCGVCSLNCSMEAIKLTKRKKRVIHPENTYERVILQSLERGNL